MEDYFEKMKPQAASGGLSWNNQPRDRHGRWTNTGGGAFPGRGTGAPGALSSSRYVAGQSSAAGSSGSAGGGVNWHTSSRVARGMGAGNFREFNVNAYKPYQVEKFTHAQARNSYDSLVQTARARFDSNPYSVGGPRGSGHTDSKRQSALEGFENHHAWPKSMGGTDHSDNMVWLTPSEHVVAHHLFSVMLRKEPKAYAEYDKTGNAQRKLIALDKGWASKDLKKSYTDHGKRINKSQGTTTILSRSYEYRDVKDRVDRMESRTQGYEEAYPHKGVKIGSYGGNAKLTPAQAESKFMEMSAQVRELRPDISKPAHEKFTFNSRVIGLQWSVGVLLPKKDRDKFDAYYNSTVKPKATLAGMKEYNKQKDKYLSDIQAIAKRTFVPKKPGDTFKPENHDDMGKNPSVKGRSPESRLRMEREIDAYRANNPKPSKMDLIAGAVNKADGISTYTYEEASRQQHLASIVARNWTKDTKHIQKKLNSYLGDKTDYKSTAKFMEVTQGHLKKNSDSKNRYGVAKIHPKKGRIVLWSQYTGERVSSNGKVTSKPPSSTPSTVPVEDPLMKSIKYMLEKHKTQ